MDVLGLPLAMAGWVLDKVPLNTTVTYRLQNKNADQVTQDNLRPETVSQPTQHDETTQPNAVPAQIHDPVHGKWHNITVVKHHQSARSWILRRLAIQCHLKVEQGRHREELVYQGQRYESASYTPVTWWTGGNTRRSSCCMVLDMAPFDMLAGSDTCADSNL